MKKLESAFCIISSVLSILSAISIQAVRRVLLSDWEGLLVVVMPLVYQIVVCIAIGNIIIYAKCNKNTPL